MDNLLIDNEFECIRAEVGGLKVILSVSTADEHVPDIERYIQTSKDCVRSTYNSLPYKRIPNLLIFELVYFLAFWLVNFLLVMAYLRLYHLEQ